MSAQCPNGHHSSTDDFCDVCGAPIVAAADPVSAPKPAPAAASSLTLDPKPVPPSAAPLLCPNCGEENLVDALFCETCGYDFTTGQLPAHSHALQATAADGTSADPTNNVWAESDARTFSTAAPDTSMNASTLASAGGGQQHNNLMPFVGVSFIISLFGIFPSQN